MMKWGKNKAVASLSPSARPFLISHVIPASWLTKFKQMSVSPQQKSNQNGGKPTSNPAITQFHSPGGRFYSADGDDAFWRLSFGDECEAAEDYISDHDEASFPPPSSCCCTRSNRVGAKTSFILPLEIGNFPVVERDKVVEVTNPRIRSEKKKKVKRSNQRVFELGSELSNSIPQMELEDTKMVEGMRKSLYIRTEQLQRKQRKSHHHSPRTPETCKIRAIEDMRRSSSKTTKRKANKPEKTGFDGLKMKSFAVVKSSYDPENDFKESMVEMIQEMRIRKTEELEELLACYLMLNCEEYHELIINVFRQVWFDLNHHAGLSWS